MDLFEGFQSLKLFGFSSKTSLPLICGELQLDVQKCYQENGKQSLHCSAEVRAFEECIEKQRQVNLYNLI